MKQLPQKKPSELFNTELPPPEFKKVELPPKKPIHADIGFWETLWLLITSVLRNKARDAMEGKPVSGFQLPVSGLLSGVWWKLGVGVLILLVIVWAIIRIV